MKPERCPTCHRRHRRSHPQNKRLWLLYHMIAERVRAEGHIYSADTWHKYFKSRFLGCEEVRLPNGKTLEIPHSTADLDVSAFNEYMEKVEHWAGARDVWLDEIAEAA